MSRKVTAFDAQGMEAPEDVKRLCVKVANQAGKGLWWNAMAAASELVVACQKGCRAEMERVAKKRAVRPKSRTKKRR